MASFAARIDYFKAKQSDETTHTAIGTILTLLLPFIIAGYVAWQAIELSSLPPTTKVDIVSDTTIVYNVTVQCIASSGCWYSQSFKSDNETCASLVKKRYSETSTQFVGRCTWVPPGMNMTIHYCYDPDPINGPTFIWKRQSCGVGQNSFCLSAYVGLIMYMDTLRISSTARASDLEKYNITVTDIQMFYGVHALAATRQSSGSSDSTGVWQITPLLLSQGEDISSTNMCCNKQNSVYSLQGLVNGTTSCDGDTNANNFYTFSNGTISTAVGQYYQAKFRAYPSYTKSHTSKSDLYYTLFSNIGGGISIVISCCSTVVVLYRTARACQSSQKVADESTETKRTINKSAVDREC